MYESSLNPVLFIPREIRSAEVVRAMVDHLDLSRVVPPKDGMVDIARDEGPYRVRGEENGVIRAVQHLLYLADDLLVDGSRESFR